MCVCVGLSVPSENKKIIKKGERGVLPDFQSIFGTFFFFFSTSRQQSHI